MNKKGYITARVEMGGDRKWVDRTMNWIIWGNVDGVLKPNSNFKKKHNDLHSPPKENN